MLTEQRGVAVSEKEDKGRVHVLNYSAHAIEDLRRLSRELQFTWAMSSMIMSKLADILEKSVKFILPNAGQLLDPADLKQAHLELLKLPFPCVAFEAPWQREGVDEYESILTLGELPRTSATRRIALCWELGSEFGLSEEMTNNFGQKYPEGGVFVVPIFWQEAEWQPTTLGAFLPYDNRPDLATSKSKASAIAISKVILADAAIGRRNKGTIGGEFEIFHVLPEAFQQSLSSFDCLDDALAQLGHFDTRDEIQMVVQACSVLNCANVGTAKIEAPVALNKKRMATGKQPFFSYHVLQLSGTSHSADGVRHNGTHASPRMHLRRGHLRRLADKTVWISASVVNANSPRGVVVKDYQINENVCRARNKPRL